MEKKKQVKFDIPAMTPEQVRDAIVQIPNLPVMYFNHSRIASSNFDLRIFFGQINITAKNQQSIVEQLCVIMTPEFAKMFMETLRTALDRYEPLFGKIRQAPAALALPEAINPGLDKLVKRK